MSSPVPPSAPSPVAALPGVGDTGRVEAVCVVHALTPDSGSVGTTAIDKRSVETPVRIGVLGLYADVQADRAHHGGPDQAVYLYDELEAGHWGRELASPVEPGWFGENLRTTGLRIDDLEIGARLRAGGALLEVTAPRTPCATFERWVGREGFRQAFHERGRTGIYCRVLEAGDIAVGDELRVVSTPGHGVSVAIAYGSPRDRDVARRLRDFSEADGIALHRELVARGARLLRDEA